jgi:hypothetical protein
MLRFLRILLFAFMFSVCMVLGVIPIIPKRKDEVVDEIIIEENDLKDDAKEKVIVFKAES